MSKTSSIVSIPVDKEFAKYFKIQASLKGISRLELSRIEAHKMKLSFGENSPRKNEENRFPFRF